MHRTRYDMRDYDTHGGVPGEPVVADRAVLVQPYFDDDGDPDDRVVRAAEALAIALADDPTEDFLSIFGSTAKHLRPGRVTFIDLIQAERFDLSL